MTEILAGLPDARPALRRTFYAILDVEFGAIDQDDAQRRVRMIEDQIRNLPTVDSVEHGEIEAKR